MEIGRSTSAISAGALAVALSVGVPLLAAAPAHAADCTGAGPLSGVTSGLCNVVSSVTGVVDGATGSAVAPVTDAVDSAVNGVTKTANGAVNGVTKTANGAVKTAVNGAVGTAVNSTVGDTDDAAETGGTVTSPSASPSSRGITDGIAEAVPVDCLPLVAGSRCERVGDYETPAAKETPEPTPTPTETEQGTLSTEPSRPLFNRPQFIDSGERFITVDPVVDPDDAGITLLWPGQYVPQLNSHLKGKGIRPRTTYDGVGAALTAALLLSAVLATRVVSARRALADQQESIPFEGMHLPGRSGGRHRLA